MNNQQPTKALAKNLLLFTIPLVLSGLFQQLFNWVDAFIVGNVTGELALAGIGATTSTYNLFLTVIIGFTSGLSVLTAQQYGRGEEREVVKTLVSYSVLLGTIFLIIAVLGFLYTGRLLRLLNTPADIFTSAKNYLRTVFLGLPFLAVYNTCSAILRGLGNSKAPFLAVLVSSLFNAALDLLLVARLGYGTAGAAAATVISQMAMTVFILTYTKRCYPILSVFPFQGVFSLEALKNGVRFGIPPAAQSGVTSVGNIYLQHFMNGFGEKTVAAITTAYRVDTVILLPIMNLSSGIATLAAQNTGAGDPRRAEKVFQVGTVLMAAVSLCLTCLVLLLGGSLIALFGLTAGSVAIGRGFFHTIAGFYLIYGISMAIRGYLEGTGDLLFSGIAGILSLGIRILCSHIFLPVFENMVVAYAEAFSWIFLLSVLFLRYRIIRRRQLEAYSSPK